MNLTEEQVLFQEIIHKAWESVDFKKELITNPLKTIEKHTGTKLNLPKDKTLVIRDQTDPENVYINISSTQSEDLELSEQQLETVSGGKNSYYFDSTKDLTLPIIPKVPTIPILK